MGKQQMFPIMNDDIIAAIPWDAIAPHEEQAQRNHSQTLRGLASRGGLSPCEALAVLTNEPWRSIKDKAWLRLKLMRLLLDFERAKP